MHGSLPVVLGGSTGENGQPGLRDQARSKRSDHVVLPGAAKFPPLQTLWLPILTSSPRFLLRVCKNSTTLPRRPSLFLLVSSYFTPFFFPTVPLRPPRPTRHTPSRLPASHLSITSRAWAPAACPFLVSISRARACCRHGSSPLPLRQPVSRQARIAAHCLASPLVVLCIGPSPGLGRLKCP